jgi:rfaE bifunctional protein kinase chain/domain
MTRGMDKPRLRRIVSSFPGKRVLVVGDLMLDHYIRGHVSRISPEAPVPVVRVGEESSLPGGAGNVAVNLAALGAEASVLGVVGPDDTAGVLSSLLSARGVVVSGLLEDQSRVTAQKTRVIAERQQVVRYDRETAGPLSGETEGRLISRLSDAVKTADAVILSDYGKGVVSPRVIKAAIAAAKKAGKPLTVDPKPEHFKLYRGVTCTTPNVHEAFAGMRRGEKPGAEEIARLGRDIVRALRSKSVLITRGPDGMSLFKADGRALHIPTQAREVFDVTGAGDTVIATLTLALAAGASLEEAAALSNHAAGVTVAKLGAATCSPAELQRALR